MGHADHLVNQSQIRVRRMTTHVGAEILNVDLSKPLGEENTRIVRKALVDHGVIFFRDQVIDSAQYEFFARQFGEAIRPKSNFIPELAGSEVISEVRKNEGKDKNIGGSWHTDQVFRAAPSWGTMLLCRQIPEHGGDTLFLSMARAYETLSAGLKKTLESLRAVHWNAAVQARMQSGKAPDPAVTHPVVIRHPESGRKILYVSPSYTTHFEGWTPEESRPLLNYLFRHAENPEWFCRFRWEKGSIAFWDNYQTWHFAVNDYDSG
ncbi:MAG: TauD/TfdA dioxygenase family protein, partial [Burkholderiales bacterium]